VVAISVWLCIGAPAFATDALEQLQYTVTYRGLFSVGQDLPIADLQLETRAAQDGSVLRESRLEASSAAYPVVESVFPIRYRFRTWSSGDHGQPVAFESYEKTRKERHRLYLRDASKSGVRRYDLNNGAGRQEMAQLEAGVSPSALAGGELLLDRLALLQRVRGQELRERAEYLLPVTNGREHFVYRIKVEGAEVLDLGGRAVAAWRLSFDGMKEKRDGTREVAHDPVLIWVSQTSDHIPLRVDSRHAVGLFRVELNARPELAQLARIDR